MSDTLFLLEAFVDYFDGECSHDHHGYCQAHMLETECSVARARQVIAEATGGDG